MAEKTTKDPVAFYTFWLTVFTLVLALVSIVQGLFLYRAEKISKSATDSVINSERARLFVEVELGEMLITTSDGAKNTVNVVIWNYGKTVARLSMIRAYPVFENQPPTKFTEFDGSEKRLPSGLGLAPNGSYKVPVEFMLADDVIDSIKRWETRWCVIGKIAYFDIFGIERETRFCWYYRWFRNAGRFEFDRESPLNYQT